MSDLKDDWLGYFIGYFPFINISLGLTGNIATVFILRLNHELRQQSSMVMFSFIAICDLIALFTWNLDTYFRMIYNFSYEIKYLSTCRLMVFLQYFGLESSGLLFSFISIDRYFTIVSRPGSKLPFGTPKTSFIWSSIIVISMFILNSHILFLNGFIDSSPEFKNETIQIKINESLINQTKLSLIYSNDIHCYVYYPSFQFEMFWDRFKLVIYSIIPTIIMVIFNTLIVFETMHLGRQLNRNDERSIKVFRKKRHLTVSLIILTFLFPIMTLPNVIFYSFFYRIDPWMDKYLGGFTNNLTFFHHSVLFFSLYLTNCYFRKAIFSIFRKKNNSNNSNT